MPDKVAGFLLIGDGFHPAGCQGNTAGYHLKKTGTGFVLVVFQWDQVVGLAVGVGGWG